MDYKDVSLGIKMGEGIDVTNHNSLNKYLKSEVNQQTNKNESKPTRLINESRLNCLKRFELV